MEALQKKPTVHGALRAHPLASLLASIAANGSTGTLVLTGPSGEVAEIVVVAGQLAKIRVPEPLYLSSVAYELGYVSAEDLNASLLDVARFRRLHGAVLLERKLLTPTQLRLCLLEQAKRKLHRMFAWPDTTTAELIPDHDALQRYGGADTPTCELRPLVWCGIREFAPSRQVDAWLAATEGHRFRGTGQDAQALGLDPEERALLERARWASRSVGELVRMVTLPRRRAELLCYCLVLTGFLEREAGPRVAESGVRMKVAMPALTPGPTTDATPAKLFERACASLGAGKLEVAAAACRQALEANPEDPGLAALRVWIAALGPDGQSELATQGSLAELGRIILAHGECAHAYYFRGQLHKRLGRHDRAASDFRRTLDLDERRVDAQSELRLYALRKQRGG